MSEQYHRTPEMGEISGFGGSYEAGCEAMFRAGMAWLDAHPDADPQFKGFRGIYGVITEENDDAKALSDAVINAPFVHPETGEATTVGRYGATGAMHQAVIGHCLACKRLGWDEYKRQLEEHVRQESARG